MIDLVYHGEEVVIVKNNLPLVDLVIHKPKGKRKLGLLAGKDGVSNGTLKRALLDHDAPTA